MNYILFDDYSWQQLLPLTFTRPVSEIRVGILTITEKWNKYLQTQCSFKTQDYLQEKFPLHTDKENIIINGSVLPDQSLIEQIRQLKPQEAIVSDSVLIAACITDTQLDSFDDKKLDGLKIIQPTKPNIKIDYPWHIFSHNAAALEQDFDLITQGRKSQPIPDWNRVINPERIFIEEGASVQFSILNASTGSIYVGKDAEIMEGCIVRGGLALCEHAALKMGAKIYGATTLGPHCKVGGEVNNSVLFGYSSKAHDGFLGNSVLGEWCNLGADTNNSNLKNNYEIVKLWSYKEERFIKTGLQFCGLIMGDHSKSGINSMFNTGTVIGVNCNIFGDGFPRNFVPSYAWGGAQGFMTYTTPKAFEVAQKVLERRHLSLTDVDKRILLHVFEKEAIYRNF